MAIGQWVNLNFQGWWMKFLQRGRGGGGVRNPERKDAYKLHATGFDHLKCCLHLVNHGDMSSQVQCIFCKCPAHAESSLLSLPFHLSPRGMVVRIGTYAPLVFHSNSTAIISLACANMVALYIAGKHVGVTVRARIPRVVMTSNQPCKGPVLAQS